jgi:U3 small nucleolar RNA-associated protein 5
MSAPVSSRSRKAEEPLQNGPASKRAKTKSSKSKSKATPAKSFQSAITANGDGKKLKASLTTSKPEKSAHAVVDLSAVVVTMIGQSADTVGKDVVEISSDSSSDSDSDADEPVAAAPTTNGVNHDKGDDEMERDEPANNNDDADSDKENAMETDQPVVEEDDDTFGALISKSSNALVNVEEALRDRDGSPGTLIAQSSSRRAMVPTTATSLSTVLAQALRTNDADLLESCFSVHDLESVRTTISRLDSSLVERLLHVLADKLHKRPGRANNLMVWVQWSLVAHGGYLATRADLLTKLGALNRVIRERASGLQPLLTLKGKLDMLTAQLELRKRAADDSRDRRDDDDDEVVIYVESDDEAALNGGPGDDNDDDDDSEEDADAGADRDDEDLINTAHAIDEEDSDEEDEDDDEDDDASEEGFSEVDSESDHDSAASDAEIDVAPTPKKSKKGKGKAQ